MRMFAKSENRPTADTHLQEGAMLDRAGGRAAVRLTTAIVPMLLSLTSGCGSQEIVHVVDPNSACARLGASYPSQHGLMLFADDVATTLSIPWCFPGSTGFGVIGYNVNISTPRGGTLLLALTDINPPVEFGATSTEGTCWGDSTGKGIVRLGYGTQWSFPVTQRAYCTSLITTEKRSEDVWFTLTATRP
jgi:hypothetical protein